MKITAFLLGLPLILLSCSLPDDNSEKKYFDYNLRGAWETTAESRPGIASKPGDSLYAKIKIDYNYITITGNIAHFENFTKNIPLEAYSDTQDSLIYINDKGEWQMHDPVSYRIWETGPYSERAKMLTIRGNGLKDETFKLIKDTLPDEYNY